MNKIYIILLIIILSSCKQEDKMKNEIRIPDKIVNINISNIASQIQSIKLETKQNCLISRISKFELFKGKIYVLDKMYNGIYQFSKDGKFLKSLNKQGRGPSEYGRIDDFLIDNKKQTIEILDTTNKNITIYNIKNFKFIRQIKLKFNFAFKFIKNNDFYYFQTNRSSNIINNEVKNAEIIVYNYKNNTYDTLLEKYYKRNENSHFELSNIFYKNGSNIYISRAWEHNILKINKGKIIDTININTNGKGYPDYILNGNYQERMSFLRSNKKADKINFFELQYQQEDNYIFSYLNGNNNNRSFLFMSNDHIYNCNRLINDITRYPKFINNIDRIVGKTAYTFIYPSNYNVDDKLHSYYNTNDEENPILLVIHLK